VDRHRFDFDAYPDPNFYFGQHIEISGKRSTLSTFSFSWNSYGIWIGMLLIPIPIRIRQNDADQT